MIYWHQTIMGKTFVTGPEYSYLDGKDIHLTIDSNLQKFSMLRIKEYLLFISYK